MAHIDSVIEKAQKDHDDEIKSLEAEFEQKKIDVADKHVKAIIGKVI